MDSRLGINPNNNGDDVHRDGDHVHDSSCTGIKNRLYRYANRGGQVSLAAPGVDIFVARRTRSYGLMTGTSAAAAHVSASIALVLQQKPDMTPKEAATSLFSVAPGQGCLDEVVDHQPIKEPKRNIVGEKFRLGLVRPTDQPGKAIERLF